MEEQAKRNPRLGASDFHKQAGEVLGEDFWNDITDLLPNRGPRMDMYYTTTSIVVLVELPGLQEPEQISLSVEGQTLLIQGEIPRLYPVTDNRIVLKERFFGSFQRFLKMHAPVTADQISAKYTQGILTIELQIEPASPQTNIEIEFI